MLKYIIGSPQPHRAPLRVKRVASGLARHIKQKKNSSFFNVLGSRLYRVSRWLTSFDRILCKNKNKKRKYTRSFRFSKTSLVHCNSSRIGSLLTLTSFQFQFYTFDQGAIHSVNPLYADLQSIRKPFIVFGIL